MKFFFKFSSQQKLLTVIDNNFYVLIFFQNFQKFPIFSQIFLRGRPRFWPRPRKNGKSPGPGLTSRPRPRKPGPWVGPGPG